MELRRLLTDRGEFVASVQVPPFAPPPTVLIWGSRVFVRKVILHGFASENGYDQTEENDYLEVFAYAVVPKREHKWVFYMNGSFCERCGAAIGSGTECR